MRIARTTCSEGSVTLGVIPVTKPPRAKTQAAVKRTRFGLVTLIAGGQSSGYDEACNRWGRNEKAPIGPVGVVGGSVRRKRDRGTWETLQLGRTQRKTGKHNRDRAVRESAEPIVAKKQGNACGAKGPCYEGAFDKKESSA